jgi:hypothetical protein
LPWFKAFASDLASRSFYGLNAAERGLLDSMTKAYWIDGSLPKCWTLLARVVRLDEQEVRGALTAAVLVFFGADESDPELLHHSELRQQRKQLEEARKRMSEGGERGAETTNGKKNASRKAGYPASQDAGSNQGTTSTSSSLEKDDDVVNDRRRTTRKQRAQPELNDEQKAWAGAYEDALDSASISAKHRP